MDTPAHTADTLESIKMGNVQCICGIVYDYSSESLFCPRCGVKEVIVWKYEK